MLQVPRCLEFCCRFCWISALLGVFARREISLQNGAWGKGTDCTGPLGLGIWRGLDPIDSIVLHLVVFYGKCRSIYQSHGSYGDRHAGRQNPAFAERCFLRQWVLTKNLKTQRTARTSRCLSTREGIYEQHQLMLEGIRHSSLQAHWATQKRNLITDYFISGPFSFHET